jgi:hypothetical protein
MKMGKVRSNPRHLKNFCWNRGGNDARLAGHFFVLKTHSLGVQFELQEFSFALDRCDPSMQEKLGAEVCARESDAGDDHHE